MKFLIIPLLLLTPIAALSQKIEKPGLKEYEHQP